MNRLKRWIAVVATLATVCFAFPSSAEDKGTDKLAQRIENSTTVYQELLSTPDRGVPDALLKKCNCIAVLPHVIKGALGYGVRSGRGVISCRNAQGEWSPPSFIGITGGSAGFQIGAESSDLVVFFMTERGARSLLTSSKFTLGGTASVAAGPVGRSGEAGTDLKLEAEIYSYSRTKGLFAGISIEGARVAADKKANAAYYGQPVTIKQLLFDHSAPSMPAEAEAFRKVLP